jgi:hypothetical protein
MCCLFVVVFSVEADMYTDLRGQYVLKDVLPRAGTCCKNCALAQLFASQKAYA